MGDSMLKLKTDSSLLQAIEKASAQKPDPEELREQRVSFIYGSLNNESDMTREEIKYILDQQDGGTR